MCPLCTYTDKLAALGCTTLSKKILTIKYGNYQISVYKKYILQYKKNNIAHFDHLLLYRPAPGPDLQLNTNEIVLGLFIRTETIP